MRYMRAMLLGTALLTGASTLAAAQAVVAVQWGLGQRDDDDRQAFREGFRQGQWDVQHNRRFDPDDNRWREGDDRRAFRAGYERGFREFGYRGDGGFRDRDGDRDDYGYRRAGYGLNAARQNGYQAGINDGARDRRTGHSFRPGHADNYHDADRGYIPNYGNKNYYKQAYREAYTRAYEQGYNSNAYWRR